MNRGCVITGGGGKTDYRFFYNSGHSLLKKLPKTKLESYVDHSFFEVAQVLWSNVPINVKMATSVD